MGNWRLMNPRANSPTKRMETDKTIESPLGFPVAVAQYEDSGRAFRISMENHGLNRRRSNYCDPKKLTQVSFQVYASF